MVFHSTTAKLGNPASYMTEDGQDAVGRMAYFLLESSDLQASALVNVSIVSTIQKVLTMGLTGKTLRADHLEALVDEVMAASNFGPRPAAETD